MVIIEFIKDIIGYIIVFVVVILLTVFVVSITTVVGDSMEGTVDDGNILLIEKVTPRFLNLKRFDIVVVKHKNPNYIVKRIIGLPGDRLSYKDNQLYINGKYVQEAFLKNVITENIDEIIIPDNEYFVLGDNRSNSVDSREFGTINKNQMEGRAIIKIWPIGEFKILGKK